MDKQRRRRVLLGAAVAGVALLAVLGGTVWYHLLRDVPLHFDSEVENFKYGSVGVEAEAGLPYQIWRVLPRVCPDQLPPAGYKAFGFIWEDGHETPVGLPLKTVGFPRLGVNCALCHTGTVRISPGDKPQVIPGAPATTLDLVSYQRFLFACASSEHFNAGRILEEIRKDYQLPFTEGLLYRFLVIPSMQKALLQIKAQLSWLDHVPDSGPGRVDAFNPAKSQILQLPPDGTVGACDMMSLWNLKPREGFGLHWDGLNDSQNEIFLNSGIGVGAGPKTADVPALMRLLAFTRTLQPQHYPLPVDQGLAAQGKALFDAQCASCHAFDGWRTGTPIANEEVGTDRQRLEVWTRATANDFNSLSVYKWRYVEFRKTGGYASVPLDGIWARAPYLHNGSVPTLYHLLEAPQNRPAVFYRGYDVLDPAKVGFVADQPEEGGRKFFRFDTSQPGNGNGGHLYGTQLQRAEKAALIEYLKTL